MSDRRDSKKLSNKVAMITGAAQGIGLAIADKFAEQGADLVLVDINSSLLEGVAEKLAAEFGVKTSAHGADITDYSAILDVVAETEDLLGSIDILINNAGVNVFSDPLSLDKSEWDLCLATNLEGAWNCARAILPIMLRNERGSIVNISSVHGHKIVPGAFPYSIAKHALIGLTRALAIEYAARGVRVNSISPGLIDTPIADNFFASQEDPVSARAELVSLIPSKRIGDAVEVANTALLLASDDATFINGADILVDGGRSQLYHE